MIQFKMKTFVNEYVSNNKKSEVGLGKQTFFLKSAIANLQILELVPQVKIRKFLTQFANGSVNFHY
jgi:hypothetical protein